MMTPAKLRDQPLTPIWSDEMRLVADVLGDRLELKATHALTPTGIVMHPKAYTELQRNPDIKHITLFADGLEHYTIEAEYFINHAIRQRDGLWLPLTRWKMANLQD